MCLRTYDLNWRSALLNAPLALDVSMAKTRSCVNLTLETPGAVGRGRVWVLGCGCSAAGSTSKPDVKTLGDVCFGTKVPGPGTLDAGFVKTSRVKSLIQEPVLSCKSGTALRLGEADRLGVWILVYHLALPETRDATTQACEDSRRFTGLVGACHVVHALVADRRLNNSGFC
ncbi:hypothetical protein FA95DRAFT_1577354 [Auriscalpium vulgare]|uniref:Uncharacterized protein n=1 Tax=Auriscalpium vulgare TaxID=40419 RepID=A0ACB8R8B6_9AGAM|nr:hypothetical protein FA95DRAFT_1577354 [Auriscalpium vulgare]